MLSLAQYKENIKKISVVIVVLVSTSLLFNFRSYTGMLPVVIQSDSVKKEIVRGIGCGGTQATGIARIVKTLEDCQYVQSGDIIVTVMTKEEWRPALERCSGIVTNLGDVHCHAALYGKRNDIPVVVGTGNSTEKVRNGDVITLDCSQRYVGHVYKAPDNDIVVRPAVYKMPAQTSESIDTSAMRVSYDYLYCKSEEIMYVQEQKANHNKEQLKITEEVFNRHVVFFEKNVFSTQTKYWWGKKTGMIEMGAAKQGCDPFSIKCIAIADDFFLGLSKNDIRLIIKTLPKKYLYYINTLIERCNLKPNDMNWVSRVVHEEHVKAIALPQDIKKEELINDPKQYKKIIDQKKVDDQERYHLIAAGLFARYWFENECAV